MEQLNTVIYYIGSAKPIAKHDEIKRSNELLRNTIDSSLDMIQVFKTVRNDEGEIIDFVWILNNNASGKFYGDVIGKSLLTLNPGVIKEGIFDTFKMVVETGQPNQSVRHYVHEQFDGWFLQSAVKQGDGITTTTKDITDIKKAEQALQDSKTLLQAVIDAPNIGVAVYKAVRDNEGQIIDFIHEYINRSSKAMLGEDVTGRPFTYHGENALLQMPQFLEVVETGKGNKYIREAEFRGRKVWFAITNTFLDTDRLVHTWEDVTEQKNAEEQIKIANESLKATLDSSLYVIQAFKAVRNESGKITDFKWAFTNKSWNQQYGDMTGKSLLSESPGVVETGLFDKFVQVTETGLCIDHEQYYSHEQFHDQWFHQTLVKMGDGFVMNTEDITARKKAEHEIREKQALLESVLNNTESSIMMLKSVRNEKGDIIDFEYEYTNDQTLRSVRRNSLVGKRMIEEFPEVNDSDLFKKYVTVAETGEGFKGEVNIDPYGYPVWAQVFAQKFTDGILVTYFDITERKKADQQLVESKELVQTVFDVTINPIAYHKAIRDKTGKIIDFEFQLENKRAREYSLENRAGQRYSEAYPGIKDTLIFEKYCNVVETGSPLDDEVSLNLKGVHRWFYLMAAKLGDGLVATAIDITERKKAEAEVLKLKDEIAQRAEDKYQTLFNTIDEGYLMADVIFNENNKAVDIFFIEANAAAKRIAGRDFTNRRLAEIDPEYEARWYELYGHVALTGESVHEVQYAKPHQQWFEFDIVRVDEPNCYRVAVIFREITERKHAEQRQVFLLSLSDIFQRIGNQATAPNEALKLLLNQLGLARAAYYTIANDENRFTLTASVDATTVTRPQQTQITDFESNIAETYRPGKKYVIEYQNQKTNRP